MRSGEERHGGRGEGQGGLGTQEDTMLHNLTAFHLHFCLVERAESRPSSLRGASKSSKRGKGDEREKDKGERGGRGVGGIGAT